MFKPTVEAALERFDDAQMMAGHLGAVKPQHDVLLLEGDTIRRDVGELAQTTRPGSPVYVSFLAAREPELERAARQGARGAYLRMLTTRATTKAVVDRAMALWTAINALAHRVGGSGLSI